MSKKKSRVETKVFILESLENGMFSKDMLGHNYKLPLYIVYTHILPWKV